MMLMSACWMVDWSVCSIALIVSLKIDLTTFLDYIFLRFHVLSYFLVAAWHPDIIKLLPISISLDGKSTETSCNREAWTKYQAKVNSGSTFSGNG